MPPERITVVGAGIVGAAVADRLSALGADVTVIDPAIGQGITALCPGGVRHQWSNRETAELVARSLPFFEGVSELDPGLHFDRCGYLFVTHRAEGVQALSELVEQQRALGIPAELLDGPQAKKLVPRLRSSVVAASYGPSDGFVSDPIRLSQALIQRARSRGTRWLPQQVTSIQLRGEAVCGVELAGGAQLPCDQLVVAAGHSNQELLGQVGVQLPLRREERRLHYLKRTPPGFCRPLVASLEQRWAGKQLGCAFYHSYLGTPVGSEDFLELSRQRGAAVLDGLEDLEHDRVVQGQYSSTPDHQAIVDRVGPSGLTVCAGLSGHGLMIAPAVAELVSQLLSGGASPLLQALSLQRFAAPAARDERAVI